VQQASGSEWDVSAQAARGRERRRRIRVAQSVAVLFAAAIVLCVVVIWQRNWVRLRAAQEQFEAYLPGLREALEVTGTLPLVYPRLDPDGQTDPPMAFIYIDSNTVHQLRPSQEPMIVAYSPSVRLILGADERIVAIREGGDIRVTIMRADQFARRLGEQQRRAEAALRAVREAGPQLP